MDVMRRVALVACVIGLAVGVAACGSEDLGVEEPASEGLALPLDGIDYNVFITRQLNPGIAPDDTYYKGPEVAPDETLYGVFIQACNNSNERRPTTDTFTIVDSQGNEFEPEQADVGSVIAYHAGQLDPEECMPPPGSLAQLGPEGASMLLFRLPLANTENRPLELEIHGRGDEKLTYHLDI